MRVAGLLLALATFGIAQDRLDPFAMERLLAPGPLAYLAIPQSPAASEDYAGSALRRFWEHEEIRSFRAPLEAWWAKRKTQAVKSPAGEDLPPFNEMLRQTAGVTIDEFWSLLGGPFTAAFYDVPTGAGHDLDLVFALGGPDAALLRRLSGQVRDVLKNQGLKDEEFAHEGIPFRALGDDAFRLYYAYLENHLVVTTTRERLEQIATSSAKKQGPALRDDADFKASRNRVSPDGRHLAHLHLNTGGALRRFRAELGEEPLKVLEHVGLADIAAVDLSLAYDGGYLRERVSLRTSRQDRGLLKWLAGRPSKDPAAPKVPAGALAYVHASGDPAGLFDVILEASKADPDMEEGFAGAVKELESMLGLNLREALGSLGTSWTAWSAYPEGGGLLPYDLSAIELKDPAAFSKALRSVLKAMDAPVERMIFRDRAIEFTSLRLFPAVAGLDPELEGVGYPLAWTLDGKTLLLSTNPLSIKRHLLDGPGKTPIAADPRFAAIAARVPAEAWESWVYLDFGRLVAAFYTMLEPALHVIRDLPRDPQTGELIVDLARLPLGETLAELIGPSLTHKRTLPDGLLLESWSKLGMSYFTVVEVAIVAAVAIPGLLSARRAAAEPAGPAANELIAQLSLQLIRQAEETARASDIDRNGAADYWTRDLAGLYGMKDEGGRPVFLIDPQTAQADPDGAARYGLTPAPKNGYFFKMMATDVDGQAYQADADKDGSAFTHPSRYGVSAWPARYGPGGRFTYILGESGKIWKMDTEGRPVDRWPGKDPAEAGWEPAD